MNNEIEVSESKLPAFPRLRLSKRILFQKDELELFGVARFKTEIRLQSRTIQSIRLAFSEHGGTFSIDVKTENGLRTLNLIHGTDATPSEIRGLGRGHVFWWENQGPSNKVGKRRPMTTDEEKLVRPQLNSILAQQLILGPGHTLADRVKFQEALRVYRTFQNALTFDDGNQVEEKPKRLTP